MYGIKLNLPESSVENGGTLIITVGDNKTSQGYTYSLIYQWDYYRSISTKRRPRHVRIRIKCKRRWDTPFNIMTGVISYIIKSVSYK